MFPEEEPIIKNENQEEPEQERLIPLPELIKDLALVFFTMVLLFFILIMLLGLWRRRIVREDPMTTQFKQLMKKGNDLSKKD